MRTSRCFGGFGSVSLGSVSLGRNIAPNFIPTISMNPFGDSFTFSPLVLHQNVSLFNKSGWQKSNPSDTGWGNQIIYSTPNMGGLERQPAPAPSGERHQGEKEQRRRQRHLTPTARSPSPASTEDVMMITSVYTVLSENHKNWMVGGNFDAKFAKFYATYGQTIGKDTDYKIKTASVGATVLVTGNSRILAASAQQAGRHDRQARHRVRGLQLRLVPRNDAYGIVMSTRP